MKFQLIKTGLGFSAILFAGALSLSETAQAGSGNVEIRAEGIATFPVDILGGHQAMSQNKFPIRFIISAETDFNVTGATLGFVYYSPDASIATITHTELPYSYDFDVWNYAFNLPSTITTLQDYDGILPDSFFTGGGVGFNYSGFGPTSLVDIIDFSIMPDSGAVGTFCVDSTFIAPAAEWIFSSLAAVSPTWGASVGGYPDGGYCVTIYEGCCVVPGDADGIQGPNVADAIFIVRYIFLNGPAPFCLAQADANGDGDFNIGDATTVINFVFLGGKAPVCGPEG